MDLRKMKKSLSDEDMINENVNSEESIQQEFHAQENTKHLEDISEDKPKVISSIPKLTASMSY